MACKITRRIARLEEYVSDFAADCQLLLEDYKASGQNITVNSIRLGGLYDKNWLLEAEKREKEKANLGVGYIFLTAENFSDKAINLFLKGL